MSKIPDYGGMINEVIKEEDEFEHELARLGSTPVNRNGEITEFPSPHPKQRSSSKLTNKAQTIELKEDYGVTSPII